jgi:hypothetical protein
MHSVSLQNALGYSVGDVLLISCEPFDTRVVRVTPDRVSVEWPWRRPDPESENWWEGRVSFPRDPDAYGWVNTPWRLEPDPTELEEGDACFVGIPPTRVRVIGIELFDPPADFGFLPRPDYVLGVRPSSDEDDEDAGYAIYLNGEEPVEIQVVEPSDRQ